MSLSHKIVMLGACLLIASPATPAVAVSTTPTDKYVAGQGAQFESLAGSRGNLTSLTNGLRTGSEITLVERTPAGPRTTTFTPATTKPMGYGNVTHSLDLANRQLAGLGITNPTAAQLQAALNGGTVRTADGNVELRGVLQLRQSGMGWGKIAHTLGVPPNSHARAQTLPHSPVAPGVTTAASAGHETGSSHGQSGRSGIVTAAGTSSASTAASSHGQGNGAAGAGIQTAAGGPSGNGAGHAYGRAGK